MQNPPYKPTTYCRYIDDIFIITNSIDNLVKLKQAFEATAILNFTYEIGTCNQLNFFYVPVDTTQTNIQGSIYQKPTNSGIYLNYNSERPDGIRIPPSVL